MDEKSKNFWTRSQLTFEQTNCDAKEKYDKQKNLTKKRIITYNPKNFHFVLTKLTLNLTKSVSNFLYIFLLLYGNNHHNE